MFIFRLEVYPLSGREKSVLTIGKMPGIYSNLQKQISEEVDKNSLKEGLLYNMLERRRAARREHVGVNPISLCGCCEHFSYSLPCMEN